MTRAQDFGKQLQKFRQQRHDIERPGKLSRRRFGVELAKVMGLRYGVTDDRPLGSPPQSTAQSIDAARARTALDRARGFIVQASDVPQHSPGREDVERSL